MLVNGCVENNNEFYTMDECKAWNNGIVYSSGLHAALNAYIQLLARVVAQRVTASIPGPTLSCELVDIRAGLPLLANQYGGTYLAAGLRYECCRPPVAFCISQCTFNNNNA